MHKARRFTLLALAALALVVVPLVARAADSPDYADNIPGSPLPARQPVAGYVNFSDASTDKDDVFAVRLKKGQWFWAQLRGASGTDFDLYLCGANKVSVESSVPAWATSERENTSMEFLRYKASADTTAYVDVFAFNGKGDYKLTYGFPSKEITVSVSAPGTCAWGGSATIRGRITERSSLASVAGEPLYLFAKPAGSYQYSYAAFTTSTPDGSYAFKVTPSKETRYLVRHLGTAKYVTPSTGPSVVITPRAYLTGPYGTPRTVKKNAAWTAYGYLKPRHSTGSKNVRVRLYKLNTKTRAYEWQKTFMATNVSYNSTTKKTKYSARVYVPSAGTWRIRSFIPGDSAHADTYTDYLYRTVR